MGAGGEQERTGARRGSGAAPALGLLLVVLTAMYLVCAVPGVREDERYDPLLDGWLQCGAYVVAALVVLLRPLTDARHRVAWLCIAGALLARAAGFVLMQTVVRGRTPVPYPSVADAAWLLTPPLLVAGLALLVRVPRRETIVRTVLDGVLAGVAAGGLALALLHDTLEDRTQPGLAADVVAVNVAYPLADVLLLFVIAAVAASHAWRPPRELTALAVGVAGFAVADAWFVVAVTDGTFRPGHAIGALSLLATAALAAAAWLPDRSDPRGPAADTVPGALVPALATAVCAGLLVAGARDTVPLAVELLAGTGLVVVFARTLLTVRELRALATAQRARQDELRRSRAAAAEQASRLGAVLEGITEHAIIGSRDGRISFFSPGAERLLGYRAAEVVGQRCLDDLADPAELQARAAALGINDLDDATVTVAGVTPTNPVTRHWTWLRRDGTQLPVELIVTRLPGDEYLGVARDTTREQALQRYRATRDALGPILGGSGPLDATLGAALRTVAEGMDWDICVLWLPEPGGEALRVGALHQAPDVASDEWGAAVRSLRILPGGGVTGRAWVEGTSMWFEDLDDISHLEPTEDDLRARVPARARTVAFVPFRGAEREGRALGVLVLIGRRRPRDTDLLELLETIAATIGLHVERAVAADALREAHDAAQAANRAKTELVAHISHELRTPLNAILGFTQLLEADVPDGDPQERVQQILAAGRHLTEVVDDLLEVAQVEQGQVRLSLGPVSATDVLREVLDLTRPLIAQRGLTLEVDVHDGLFRYVHADFQRLRQILLNLVSNAVKYNRDGGRISVRIEADAAPGMLRFAVRDTGPGIAPDRLAALFRPFERLEAATGGQPGTGLGLYVSRGLAEAMGGSLGVTSELGTGSTFFVDLPPTQATAPPAPARRPAGTAGNTRPRTAVLPPATILLVEDNPANVRLVEHIFAREPAVRLLAAASGAEGVRQAAESAPDLVLLDLQLPDLDGAAVLERLQADDRTAAIPVIVLSAFAGDAHAQALIGAGATAYLTKPLDVPALLDAVAAVLPAEAEHEVAAPAPGEAR